MSELKIPKLVPVEQENEIKKVPYNPNKPKILLLSDDLRMHSGIATMSREFVVGTLDQFNWVQLGSAQHHVDHGKVFDLSPSLVSEEKNLLDPYLKIYAHTGYGNYGVLAEIIQIEKPNAILHFTDPRYWDWLYSIENVIRQNFKLPIMYYNIWDCPPAPFWNKPFYESCDLVMNISKQTHSLVNIVLGNNGNNLDVSPEYVPKITNTSYIPHGINPKHFYKIVDENNEDFNKYKQEFYKRFPGKEFIIFWNNRNASRKHPGDVVLAYKTFCDALPEGESEKCLLFMHTDPIDNHGTNLLEVKKVICPEYSIYIDSKKISTKELNYLYNLSDVTLNIASNEGFGLSNAESMMTETMVICNVTGGLQDQIGFIGDDGNPIDISYTFSSNHAGKYKDHGDWAVPVFPSNRSLQGSVVTPYIFDDRASYEDVAKALRIVFDIAPDERSSRGKLGKEFLERSKMTSEDMSRSMAEKMNQCIENFKVPNRFVLEKFERQKYPAYIGIENSEN